MNLPTILPLPKGEVEQNQRWMELIDSYWRERGYTDARPRLVNSKSDDQHGPVISIRSDLVNGLPPSCGGRWAL